jgi:hypothetical protein
MKYVSRSPNYSSCFNPSLTRLYKFAERLYLFLRSYMMRKSFTILLICVLHLLHLHAQQPPVQLPPLLDDSYSTPVLRGNEDPEAVIRKSIFVKAFAGKQTIFTGQPVMVTYKLYSCIFCRSRVSKQPSFNGCSVTELPYSSDAETETINGKTFHVYTIRKVQVIPLEEGPLHLGEAAIDNIVPFSRDNNSADNFSITTVNEPLILQVKPLPVKDRPKNFSGVVGSFSMETAVDYNNIPVGDNASLRITIKGSGNFAGIHLPDIVWPQGTEHFEASDTQHINQDNYPISGDKVFSVPFIGSKEGNTVIGPVSFNFFDPAEETYKTITTGEVPVIFTKAINREAQLQDIVEEDVGNSKYLWIVGAIAAMVVVSWVISTQLKKRKSAAVLKEPQMPAPKQEPVAPPQDYGTEILSALNRLGYVEDDKRFLSAASYLLATSLQLKFAANDADADELINLLKHKENNTELARLCNNIFADCNRNLYSPDSEEGIKEKIYFELSAVIKKLYPIA